MLSCFEPYGSLAAKEDGRYLDTADRRKTLKTILVILQPELKQLPELKK